MGVRTYTLFVTSLPYHSPGASVMQSDVTVDWSSVTDVSEFMKWIGTCPRPSGIRVYLPSVAHRASLQRLQRSLQSMGCTVTCRVVSQARR
jgi:hypothetical protein